jgi:hypothetical protein
MGRPMMDFSGLCTTAASNAVSLALLVVLLAALYRFVKHELERD